jgi:hypothetical protein
MIGQQKSDLDLIDEEFLRIRLAGQSVHSVAIALVSP